MGGEVRDREDLEALGPRGGIVVALSLGAMPTSLTQSSTGLPQVQGTTGSLGRQLCGRWPGPRPLGHRRRWGRTACRAGLGGISGCGSAPPGPPPRLPET